MEQFRGMKIHVSPLIQPVPVLRLHPDVPCSDAFRADMNNWLLKMFGKKDVAYMLGDGRVVLSPKHYAMLRSQNE
jgi:hypothetical protein